MTKCPEHGHPVFDQCYVCGATPMWIEDFKICGAAGVDNLKLKERRKHMSGCEHNSENCQCKMPSWMEQDQESTGQEPTIKRGVNVKREVFENTHRPVLEALGRYDLVEQALREFDGQTSTNIPTQEDLRVDPVASIRPELAAQMGQEAQASAEEAAALFQGDLGRIGEDGQPIPEEGVVWAGLDFAVEEDMVDNPRHYKLGIPDHEELEVIDVIRAILGPDGFKTYCHGAMIKYVLRKKFDMDEDIAKAGKYSEFYGGKDV